MATDIKQQALEKHYEWQGKIEVISRAPVNTREDLSLCYTPGVAQACLEIEKDPSLSEFSCSYHGRYSRAWSWRYRRTCRYARNGRQMLSVQGVRRR